MADMSGKIKIGDIEAERGRIARGHLTVGRLAMGSDLKIPVLIINGTEDGPVLWLNGAVHGDELNALMVMRRIACEIDSARLAGAVVCTPLANPLAVHWRNKINPYDFLDLDQQFPGKADGTYSQRVAFALFSRIRAVATHLISFHTVGSYFSAEPYTVYKYAPGASQDMKDTVEKMALAFSVRLNCRVDLATATGEIAGGVAGALDVACSSNGIPAFMAEIGSGGQFQEDAIRTGVDGVRSVMRTLGMEKGDPTLRAGQIRVTKRAFVYSDHAGFLSDPVAPGVTVAKGEPLAKVVDFFDEIGLVLAPHTAQVIMIRKEPVLHIGDRVAFVGLEWEPI